MRIYVKSWVLLVYSRINSTGNDVYFVNIFDAFTLAFCKMYPGKFRTQKEDGVIAFYFRRSMIAVGHRWCKSWVNYREWMKLPESKR